MKYVINILEENKKKLLDPFNGRGLDPNLFLKLMELEKAITILKRERE